MSTGALKIASDLFVGTCCISGVTSSPAPLLLWLQAQEASRRQGVCIGLAEVLENITRQQLQEHLSELLPAVQSALCDSDAGVRQVGTGSVLPLAWYVATHTVLRSPFRGAG